MAAVSKALKKVPAHTPGQGVRENIVRSVKVQKSDPVAFGDTTPINLVEMPGNVLITGGLVYVTAAFDASGTSAAATVVLTAPNDTGTETLFDASTISLQSTGWKAFTGYAVTPASGGYLIASYTAGTTTAGQFQVYVEYVTEADQL